MQTIPPFLRWAGGKTWLVKRLNKDFRGFHTGVYHEPFLGGGSVFFDIMPDRARLSDANSELIETYQAIQSDVFKVIDELIKFENSAKNYYRLRDSKFRNIYKKAARFIFLNKTSFNGIYRVNKTGKYNVPYGHRATRIFEPEHLLFVQIALQGINLSIGDFSIHEEYIQPGDFVFLDPPYTVTHNNNGFIKYNQRLFSLEDQHRLSRFIDLIRDRQAYYLLTNAAHNKIFQIFHKGDYQVSVSRASLIGGVNASRGMFDEFLFTNAPDVILATR